MAGDTDVPIDVPVGPAPHDRLYDYDIAPQQVAPSPLHAVAESLAPLSADLASLGTQLADKQKKSDAAQADKDFWNQNSQGAAAALANGTLPHDKSPAYMDAWGANAGLNDALRLQQSIGPQYNSLDKTSPDPKAFDSWFFGVAQGSANPSMQQNEGYAKAYGAGIARLHAEMSGRYVTDRSDAVKAGAQQEFTAAVGNQINVDWPTGASPIDSTAMAGQLDQIRQKAIQAGMDPAFVEKSIIDVVHTKALDHKSTDILPVLNAMTRDPADPTTAKLGETEYGAAKSLETKNAVSTRLIQDRERQQAQQKIADEAGYKTAVTGILGQWAKDPNYAPTQDEIAQASKHDPLFASKIAELRKNVLANNTDEDPVAKATLYEDLLQNGGGQQAVMDAVGHGTLKTADSIKEASAFANTVQTYNATGGPANKITEDPTFKRYVAVIESSSKDPKWVSSVTGGTGVTIGGRNAVNDLTAAAMQHATQFPNEGPIARQKFLKDLGEGVMSGFGGQDATGDAMKPYTRPAGVDTQMPAAEKASAAPTAAPAAAPLPSSPAAKPSPAASPGPAGAIDTPEKALAAIKAMPASPQIADLPKLGVSPEVIQKINTLAASRGITPQALLDTMHGEQQTAPPTPAAAPASDGGRGLNLAMIPGLAGLAKLDPDVAQHVQHFVQQMMRLAPGGDAAAPSAPAASPSAPAHETLNEVPESEGHASIRYNNPGAQWPNPLASRYGSTGYGNLADGNKIARFPTPVHGAASNMALLATRYAGMTISQAQQKWSGNHRAELPGYDGKQVITPAMTDDPKFMVPFMKAMADAEAPAGSHHLSEEDWQHAFEMYHTTEGEHSRLAER